MEENLQRPSILLCGFARIYDILMASRKALLLGAGFVVKPTLTLLSDKGVEVTVGTTIKLLSFQLSNNGH